MNLYIIVCYASAAAAAKNDLDKAMLFNGYRGANRLELSPLNTARVFESLAAVQAVIFPVKDGDTKALSEVTASATEVQRFLKMNYPGYEARYVAMKLS